MTRSARIVERFDSGPRVKAGSTTSACTSLGWTVVSTRRFPGDEELRRIQRVFQAYQKTIEALQGATRFDDVIKGLPTPSELKNLSGAASTFRFDSAAYNELIRGFEGSEEAVQRLSKSLQANQEALERLSKSFQASGEIDKLSSVVRNPRVLEAIQSGLRIDRVTFNLISAASAGADEIDLGAAITISSEEPVDLPTLVGLYADLQDKNRRELRNRVLGVLFGLLVYINRLYEQKAHEALGALLGLWLLLLYLHTAVLDALDVLEEERAGE